MYTVFRIFNISILVFLFFMVEKYARSLIYEIVEGRFVVS